MLPSVPPTLGETRGFRSAKEKYTKGSPRSQGFVRCNLRRVGKDHALPTSWGRLRKNSELAGETRLSMMRGWGARPNLGRPATASKASAGNRLRPTVRWFGAAKQPAEQSHRQVQEQRDQRDRGDRRRQRQKGYERRPAKFRSGDDKVPQAPRQNGRVRPENPGQSSRQSGHAAASNHGRCPFHHRRHVGHDGG